MGLPKITFNIASEGLNRLADAVEKIPGLVITGNTVATKVTIGESYQIFSLKDAETLGIEATGVNDFAHKHIAAFYNEAATGTPLWIMLVSDATTMEEMADVNEDLAKKLINDAKGAIRVLGIIRKSTGSETVTEGLDDDVKLAAVKGQALAEYFEAKYMPFRFILSGNKFDGVPANLFDYQTVSHNKGHILIANTDASAEASVGLELGRYASIPTQRSGARVKDGPIEPLAAYFTNGEAVESLADAWDTIHDKGYTFMRTFAGRSGYYLTDDRTLTDVSDDFSALARGFVMDEALLIAYDALVDELSDEVPITAAGAIHPAIIKAWQNKVSAQLEGLMVAEGKLSNVAVFIDENQNVLENDKLVVGIQLQPVGYAKFIEVNIGFTTQINN
ncbi:DUF2586 family protein [Pseudotamlana carrageenivorans]|uniref:Phage tail protein n=1 Tax=Pseudotamlana carrageenivorans TaxID=2069432 RepID=A0A2I7SKM1_9FLAO|nr:DUF2586 family protein [Tamlana carrageenivorans]AUS06479.1 hypothetical protein C1A40_13950 [Tamlana carrageenivorans]